MNYKEFLQGKINLAKIEGLQIRKGDISPVLFDFQKDIVKWAVSGGNRAIFASFGLGKTLIQLEVMRQIVADKPGLIIMPLGVRQEFREMAEMLGMELTYITKNDEIDEAGQYQITNYERVRDGDIDVNKFEFVSLDEASVLRSFGTKTYQTFLEKFKNVPHKYVATATPSPNKYKELIHYAGFLGIMDTGQALTRYFKRDSTKANNLTLYEHKEKEFWMWVGSWAMFVTKPSDLGYSDKGYDLPKMNIIYHELPVDHTKQKADRDGTVRMFRDAAMGLKEAANEKRETLPARIDKMNEIIQADPEDHFIIWHDLEDERRAIEKALPESKSAYGSQDIDKREQIVVDFAKGDLKYLATKPVISGSGANFQKHCHNAIFLGIGYKFNDFIQSIHRIYRFLQDQEVNIHIIYSESEREILKVLQKKWQQHDEMVSKMVDIVKKYGLSHSMGEALKRSMGIERQEVKSELFTWVNNDTVEEHRGMDENSVDLIVTSIPFSNHYEYSPSYNDFGHNEDNRRFFEQMDYLTPELLRVLRPGRVAAIHVKDRILFGNATGYGMPTVDPFSAMTIFHYMQHGFMFMGQITIETDVVRENNQTYRLGWTEQCKDGTKMGVGCPEYVLLFRKLPTDTSKAYADLPVTKSKEEYSRGRWQIDARAKWNSSGNRFFTPEEIKQMPIDQVNKHFAWHMKNGVYNYDTHVATAEDLEKAGRLPATFETLKVPARTDHVWSDVNRMNTLNSKQSQKNLQQHICPLQFDITERLINRYSNPGELVDDPFGGLGTVLYSAMKLGRKGIGTELNPDYWFDGLQYLRAIESNKTMPTLFDLA